jgi:glycosyltransferase involved in cell wall biosynthesis
MQIMIIGPAHPLRGGLATFNHRLAREFIKEGNECSLVSFSLQYPGFMFPGTTQYSSDPPPEGLVIHTWINSVNPVNWLRTGYKIKNLKPDLIVVRYWLPVMGPALGTILKIVKRNHHTKIICIADNVIPHEKRPGDNAFTKYFLSSCDGFITMSEKVLSDLRKFTARPAKLVQHPLYDTFGPIIPKEEARKRIDVPSSGRIILFFGFIRHYKGLDLLLHAMADQRIRNENIRLLIAGEFYEDDRPYRKIIEEKNLDQQVILRTSFIPDGEVAGYLCSGDCVVQPYRNATQSGVTPLAYHFEKPMIVTNVGGLPSLVPDKKAGLVCEPDSTSIADAILQFYQLGENYFIPHLRTEKEKYSWGKLTEAIKEVNRESGYLKS